MRPQRSLRNRSKSLNCVSEKSGQDHSAKARNNVIYVAAPTLQLEGLRPMWPGGGVFERLSPELCLTALGSRKRSHWSLPRWFDRKPPLSYHANRTRWSCHGTSVLLETVGRGQEFVLNCGSSPEPVQWLRGLFHAQRATN
ncbi:MAG: hypothetical protein ACHQ4J_12920 [Candidatus Binatia bacterium]